MAGAIVLLAHQHRGRHAAGPLHGWRLGTNRRMQFRYQAAGISWARIMAVLFAKLFMAPTRACSRTRR
jgi:hypothetical protein